MLLEISHRSHALHLQFSGRFEFSDDASARWPEWSDEINDALPDSGWLAFVDLRNVTQFDSRCFGDLLDVIEPLRTHGEVIYLGPGAGLSRLAEEAEVPPLLPMLDRAPWESDLSSESVVASGQHPPSASDPESGVEGNIRVWLEGLHPDQRNPGNPETSDGAMGPLQTSVGGDAPLFFEAPSEPVAKVSSRGSTASSEFVATRRESADLGRDGASLDSLADGDRRETPTGTRSEYAQLGTQRLVECLGELEFQCRHWRSLAETLSSTTDRPELTSWVGPSDEPVRGASTLGFDAVWNDPATPGDRDAALALADRFYLERREGTAESRREFREGWSRSAAELASTISSEWLPLISTLKSSSSQARVPMEGHAELVIDDMISVQALLVTISTLHRERHSIEALERRISDLVLVALGESEMPIDGDGWGDASVWRAAVALLSGGPSSSGVANSLPSATDLAEPDERTFDWWQAVRRLREGGPRDTEISSGLDRILDTHSCYLPGCWVELSSGEVGIVVAARIGDREKPRVLVQFDRRDEALLPVTPRWYPSAAEDSVRVVRVLERPRLELAVAEPVVSS